MICRQCVLGRFYFPFPSIADPSGSGKSIIASRSEKKEILEILIRTSFAPAQAVAPAPASLPVAKAVSIYIRSLSAHSSASRAFFARKYRSVLFIHMASIVDPQTTPVLYIDTTITFQHNRAAHSLSVAYLRSALDYSTHPNPVTS